MIQDDSSFGNGVRVDCNDGESINRAIRRSNLSEKLTIVVRGTCVENVVIDRDWVTLQPSKWGGGSIEAADETKDTIRITGRHVTVQDFDGASISGGSNGILVTDGAAASILRNTITDNGVGVVVDGASSDGWVKFVNFGAEDMDFIVDGTVTCTDDESSARVSGGVTITGGILTVTACQF